MRVCVFVCVRTCARVCVYISSDMTEIYYFLIYVYYNFVIFLWELHKIIYQKMI